ncbi:S1-like domain-containing RNA-binding protein [uncultured Fibrobacter sp.]|uniref:CvfB family protein n=1 Tax=uncultured Fibrobacter sp. TaxID=261512 RepID=UPI002803D931|nr:S1-like domain-containing RNA-binding protein [uncultured Fibrobacter sp.]
MHIGHFEYARVEDVKPQGFYLEVESGGRVLLPGSKAPEGLQEGDELEVFIYVDNEGRPIATIQKPYATVGDFAVLEVKDVNEVGAFLDWGLDKDLFLPYKQQLGKLLPGDRCVVYILEDERTARIVATEKIKAFIDRDTRDLHISQKVDLAVYDVAEDYVDFLVNYRYTGRLHLNSFIQDTFEIGDCGEGYIQNIREDGGLSISLKPVGYHATMDAADDIIQKLEEAGGSLPYSDNSSPEEIQQEFGVSKKAFKKIIGGLFRQGRIFIGNDGIRLAPKKENRRFSHQKPRKNFRKHP